MGADRKRQPAAELFLFCDQKSTRKVPLYPQRGGKKPNFTSKITIRRFLRRNPAFSDYIPARPSGRGVYLPQGFRFMKNTPPSVGAGHAPPVPRCLCPNQSGFAPGTPTRRGGVPAVPQTPPRRPCSVSAPDIPLSSLHSSLSNPSPLFTFPVGCSKV